MEIPWKIKNRITIWPSNSSSGYPSKKNMKILTWKNTFTLMFIAALFTMAQVWKQCIDQWMDKEIVVLIYLHLAINQCNGIQLSYKKEQNLSICNNMDGTWRYYAKWTKSDRERKILYDLSYMWNITKQNKNPSSLLQRTDWWLQGVGGKWKKFMNPFLD